MLEGKIVKVKDMKPGYLYSLPSEKFIDTWEKYRSYCDNPEGCELYYDIYKKPRRDAYEDLNRLDIDVKLIPEGGVLLKTPEYQAKEIGSPERSEKYVFKLVRCVEKDECARSAPTKQHDGWFNSYKTGNKVWKPYPEYSDKPSFRDSQDSIYFYMEPNAEMLEVYPFPIMSFTYTNDFGNPMYYPNPWTMRPCSAEKMLTKDTAPVVISLWTEKEVKIMATCGLIGGFMLLLGPAAWAMGGTFILVPWMIIKLKHQQVKMQIKIERLKHGVRGNSMDHLFWYDE